MTHAPLRVGLLLVAAATPAWAEDADLARLQGRWQRLTKDGQGRTIRVVKVHEGRTTGLTAYDAEGQVVYGHTSEFELGRTGDVRTFTYFNLVVTAGPNPGPTGGERHTYVYRVVGDRFVEVHGLLVGQEDEEPTLIVWDRMKD